MDTADRRSHETCRGAGGRGPKVRLIFNSEWDMAVAEFIARVVSEFRENVLGIIALNEDREVYGSNLLIIARSRDPEVVSKILGVKREVERRFGDRITMSLFIAGEEDIDIARLFEKASGDQEEAGGEELLRALEMFSKMAKALEGVVRIVVPRYEIYESNVLVVVKNTDPETISRILSVKREVERSFGDRVVISPFVAGEGDEGIIRAFEEASGTSS